METRNVVCGMRRLVNLWISPAAWRWISSPMHVSSPIECIFNRVMNTDSPENGKQVPD